MAMKIYKAEVYVLGDSLPSKKFKNKPYMVQKGSNKQKLIDHIVNLFAVFFSSVSVFKFEGEREKLFLKELIKHACSNKQLKQKIGSADDYVILYSDEIKDTFAVILFFVEEI